MENKYKNISAFTLAEVLITIVIISLLALITLPILKGGVDSKVTDSQKKTFEQKLKENFHAMQSAGALSDGYDSTEDFINAMKKYMNINKSCKSNKLSECFAEKVITEEKEVKYNTKQMSTSKDISAGFTEESDLGGVVFADGTTAIIAHDPDCYIKDKYDSSIDATACIAMIYDINGKNAPNILGVDVHKLNINPFGLSFEIIGDKFYDNTKAPGTNDYWLGAKQACEKIGGRLPTPEEAEEITAKVYPDAQCSTVSTKNGRIWYNYCNKSIVEKKELYKFTRNQNNTVGTWTSTEGFFRTYWENQSDYNNDPNWRYTHGTKFMCVR